jgi:hypothetical protein
MRKDGLELRFHRELQAALHKRLVHLGADKNASNPARYIRMPGSLNTKSETIVSWEVQVDADCHIPRYTLSQLNERLGIAHTPACPDKETARRTPRDFPSSSSPVPIISPPAGTVTVMPLEMKMPANGFVSFL